MHLVSLGPHPDCRSIRAAKVFDKQTTDCMRSSYHYPKLNLTFSHIEQQQLKMSEFGNALDHPNNENEKEGACGKKLGRPHSLSRWKLRLAGNF